jgi:hypothetical protein
MITMITGTVEFKLYYLNALPGALSELGSIICVSKLQMMHESHHDDDHHHRQQYRRHDSHAESD